jgi:hypothetical protein
MSPKMSLGRIAIAQASIGCRLIRLHHRSSYGCRFVGLKFQALSILAQQLFRLLGILFH